MHDEDSGMTADGGLFLLIDLNNGGVLHAAPNRHTMIAILKAVPDVMPLSIPKLLMKPSWTGIKFTEDLLCFSPLNSEFLPILEHQVTPDFLERRERVRSLSRKLQIIQSYCLAALDTLAIGPIEQIETDLRFEIESCKPEDGQYSDCLHEYASRVGKDVAALYAELAVKLDSIHVSRVRNHSIYEMFVDLTISETTITEAELIERVRRELIYNSHV